MNSPKVLIVGNHFDLKSGGGITMTNLFKGWDKDKIAVVAYKIENPDFTICERYYQLGSLECKQRFPYNFRMRGDGHKSGIITETKPGLSSISSVLIENPKPKNFYHKILQSTGIVDHYIPKLEVSNELLEWIREYSPEILYTMLASLELIRFVDELRRKSGIPVAVHIMDDWPSTIASQQKGPFKYFWHSTIEREFRKLLAKSTVKLSISEAMSDEYLRRYGISFQPFHNPIDVKYWSAFSKTSYESSTVFTILYAGRIGTGLTTCLKDVAKAINNLIKKGYKIEFRIQSTTKSPFLDELVSFGFVKLNPIAPYSELPKIFSQSDLLLMPNDFDAKSITFLKYSMPTKASEYMVSGTPILLYSSPETAVAMHAAKYNWAYVVSENDTGKLETAIAGIYQNTGLRERLGNTARDFAIRNYDDIIIRDLFRKSLIVEQELN
ncbi:MAG: hypothetical protein ACOYMF_13640 [Bacteroidales bacterium]